MMLDIKGLAKSWAHLLGHLFLCLVFCHALRLRGRFPWWGGSSDPSVPPSPKVTLQEGRAAHGPLHPAVTSPPRLCWFCVWFLLGFSGMDVGYSVWFSWSLGLECCLACRMFVVPLSLYIYFLISLSLSLVFGIFVGAVFHSFSSLRCWGNLTPFGVWVSPCVSSSWPRSPSWIRTPSSASTPRSGSRTFFFAVAVVRWYGGGWSLFVWSLSGWGVFFFFLVSVLAAFLALHAFMMRRIDGWRECDDHHTPHYHYCGFWGDWVSTSDPHVTHAC